MYHKGGARSRSKAQSRWFVNGHQDFFGARPRRRQHGFESRSRGLFDPEVQRFLRNVIGGPAHFSQHLPIQIQEA